MACLSYFKCRHASMGLLSCLYRQCSSTITVAGPQCRCRVGEFIDVKVKLKLKSLEDEVG